MTASTERSSGKRAWRYFRDLAVLLCALSPFANSALAVTKTATFNVEAPLQAGCMFGLTSGSSSDMGTLSFGTQNAAATNVNAVSGPGSGSIVVTCTPGVTVTIALDYGINGGSSAQRYLANSAKNRMLPYQLYRDAARTQVWGSGQLALNVSSFPNTTQTYTVYARYIGATPLPAAGQYTDKITINVTY